MKCESCLELLNEYFDGELAELESLEIAAHLAACSSCAGEIATLSAEQEMFSRYDRELTVPVSMWEQIAERTTAQIVAPVSRNGFAASFAALFRVPVLGFAATAVLIAFALVLVMVYTLSQKPKETVASAPSVEKSATKELAAPLDSKSAETRSEKIAVVVRKSKPARVTQNVRKDIDQSDVLSSDFGYQDIDDQEMAKHLEQTQNLLRSIRNVQLNDNDQEIDISYDKALSRRLLNENIILRRDAEMKAKFPTKMLLSDLEPFLIDIANLPAQAKPEDVRVIKERVQRTEIVAALIGY